jgi:ArsR family transcriptional regulator, lead/cadmium/zinc/bismuth-responsive transcriptional repressor
MYSLNEDEYFELELIFKMMADTTRLRIFEILFDQALSVNEIVDKLGISQSAISHQLAQLRKVKLVSADRVGQSMIYRLKDDHVKMIFNQALDHIRE